jgi:hypothetical protein
MSDWCDLRWDKAPLLGVGAESWQGAVRSWGCERQVRLTVLGSAACDLKERATVRTPSPATYLSRWCAELRGVLNRSAGVCPGRCQCGSCQFAEISSCLNPDAQSPCRASTVGGRRAR